MSSDWPRRCDVFRKWVLNEHGWYSAAPWNLPAHSFEAVSGDDFRLPRPRRLLPCLSTNPDLRSLGVVVEVRPDAAASWRQWRGPLWFSRDECVVYFGGDALGGEYFQAAVQGAVQVRVTATVAADVRVQAQLGGAANCGLDVLDLATRAAWRRVHPSSVFYRAQGVGVPAERDDTDLLQRAATRHQESLPQVVQARLQLGWVDATFGIGDIVEAIDGRDLDLQGSDSLRPTVVAVRHDFRKQSTQLEVKG